MIGRWGSSAWLTSREFPPPCDPRPCCHRRIRWSWRVGRYRGSASEEADGITAHDRGRRNHGRHGATGRVGDLLLASVLGLGLVHFPFGLDVARSGYWESSDHLLLRSCHSVESCPPRSRRFSGSALVLAVVAVVGCAPAPPRDAAWARRQIIESECRTWAQSQARAEYAPQIQNAARQQSYFVRSGNSAGAGLAGSTVALAQLAQQGRENELFEACMIERGTK